jgi:hypothetical protein
MNHLSLGQKVQIPMIITIIVGLMIVIANYWLSVDQIRDDVYREQSKQMETVFSEALEAKTVSGSPMRSPSRKTAASSTASSAGIGKRRSKISNHSPKSTKSIRNSVTSKSMCMIGMFAVLSAYGNPKNTGMN